MITHENVKNVIESYCPKHGRNDNIQICLFGAGGKCIHLKLAVWEGDGEAYYCAHEYFKIKRK